MLSADPSSMTTRFCFVAVTVRFKLLCDNSRLVGLTRSSPEQDATRTAAVGPSQGMSEMARAADAAFIARMSGLLLPSRANGLHMI